MSIPALSEWLETPQGGYLLEWEQQQLETVVADIFGYNALQLGLSRFDLLSANRMPFRFRCDLAGEVAVIAGDDALPFATASIDLVVLPHVLEFAERPHQVLREVERVLVPEGSVVISGFNPYSLWGMRRLAARKQGAVPWSGQYLSVIRIRDWLTLLGFETQPASFGCYAPAVTAPNWLERWRFMDRFGARWWPVCGGAYVVQGIKRVQGTRVIMPNWNERRARSKRLSAIAQQEAHSRSTRKTQ